MSPDFSAVFAAAERENALIVWAIFDKPRDFPEHFVVRPSIAARRGVIIWPEAWLCDTLEQARALLPPGLTCLPHGPGDPRFMVEAWL